MIRVILYLVIVSLLALAAVWLADRPGEVAVTWQGWRIETSVMMLVVAIAAVAVSAVILWSILRAIMRRPICCGAISAPAAACAVMLRCRRV